MSRTRRRSWTGAKVRDGRSDFNKDKLWMENSHKRKLVRQSPDMHQEDIDNQPDSQVREA